MCRMLVIATILSPRSCRYQTSYLLLFHLSFYLLINLWGCAPFLMGLCPLSFPGALFAIVPASVHSAVSTATIVRVTRRLCPSSYPRSLVTLFPRLGVQSPDYQLNLGPRQSQPSRPATPGPSATGSVVTLAVPGPTSIIS